MNLVGTKGYKHYTNLLPPDQPLNTHTARVGSGIGALAVKKKAAVRTAQEEILLELKTRKNQEKSCPTIKKKQATTNHQSEFISSTP
ncbi:MAG: hypothetical protein DHS20C18_48600 [Saprospiraceae bacterium]|nr:MAG: hypothetical protein DHS20C18_48600 [Saprospiraceae bacterium]